MSRLLLVRHAQAMIPGDFRLPGPDVGLVPGGVIQARRLADRLRDLAPGSVFASDALRARHTGEIIGAICGIPCQTMPDLRELDFGAWGGLTYAEVVAADPAASAWFANPAAGSPPGGEPAAGAAERVLRVLRTIADGDADCVVVGHAGSSRLAMARALGMPLASYWRLRLDCASLSVVTWSADGPVLERWNDTAHLEPDPVAPERPVSGKDTTP